MTAVSSAPQEFVKWKEESMETLKSLRQMVAMFAAVSPAAQAVHSATGTDPFAGAQGAARKRFSAWARWHKGDDYFLDEHGSTRRVTPKRDKSMSARQWRKLRRPVRAFWLAHGRYLMPID